jgi:hypothetical protein
MTEGKTPRYVCLGNAIVNIIVVMRDSPRSCPSFHRFIISRDGVGTTLQLPDFTRFHSRPYHEYPSRTILMVHQVVQ